MILVNEKGMIWPAALILMDTCELKVSATLRPGGDCRCCPRLNVYKVKFIRGSRFRSLNRVTVNTQMGFT